MFTQFFDNRTERTVVAPTFTRSEHTQLLILINVKG